MDTNTQIQSGMSRTSEGPRVVGTDPPTASDAAMIWFRQYAQENPETVVLWALGIGFVLGWKLKPW